MDAGRRKDLERIDKRLNTTFERTKIEEVVVDTVIRDGKKHNIVELNPVSRTDYKHDKWGKEQAARARTKILQQSKDKTLTRLRTQLMRAARAGDKQAEVQLTARIRAYEKQPFEDYA